MNLDKQNAKKSQQHFWNLKNQKFDPGTKQWFAGSNFWF